MPGSRTRAPAAALRPALLHVRGIGQHHAQELARCRRCINRSAEAELDEPRQQSRVIDVRVREQHELDRGGIERERCAIFTVGVGTALEHAIIDQKRAAGGLDAVTRARHFARRAQKCDFHNGE